MACSVVLLDLDGTLVDSQPGIMASCRAAIRSLGHEAGDLLDARALIGPPMHDVMRILLSPLGDHRIEEGVTAYREHYGRKGLFQSRIYPGVADALAGLRAEGKRLFVATSKRTLFAEQLLRHLGLADFFDSIHGSEPGGTLDEKDELIRHILALHGLAAGNCVMVGDRRFDVIGAHANAVRAVGALWGYGTRDELEGAGADELADRPEDLLGLGHRS